MAAGRLDRVLRFFAPISIVTNARAQCGRLWREHHDHTQTAVAKSCLLNSHSVWIFSDKGKPRNELRSIKKVFLKYITRKVDKTEFPNRKIKE